MNTEIALLQVHLSTYSPGDKISKSEAKTRNWLYSWEYQAEPVTGKEGRIWAGDLYKFYGTAIALDVKAFGEGHDEHYHCGLDAELTEYGLEDIFQEEKDRQRIIDLGKDSLVQYNEFGKHAHYILAVKCNWWKEPDTWVGPGEYESSFEILGRVDLSILKLVSKEGQDARL